MTRGREAYERDLKRWPNYHDGTPRKTWDELPEIAKQSWERRDEESGTR